MITIHMRHIQVVWRKHFLDKSQRPLGIDADVLEKLMA